MHDKYMFVSNVDFCFFQKKIIKTSDKLVTIKTLLIISHNKIIE